MSPRVLLACLVFLLVACSSRSSEPQGVMPNNQRAGEVGSQTEPAKAFLKLYPDAVVEMARDRCESEIGEGRACDGPEHFDVTFTHTDEGTPPRVTKLAVEVGRGETVMGTVPSSLLVYDGQACVEDADCVCSPCTGCTNRMHLSAKIAAEAPGCTPVGCQAAGCSCRGGKCRTH